MTRYKALALSLALPFVLGLTMSGCQDEAAAPVDPTSNGQEQIDTTKQSSKDIQVIMSEVVKKIDANGKTLSEQKQAIDSNKKEFDDYKGTSLLMNIVALGMALVSVLMAGVCIYRSTQKVKQRLDRHRKELDGIQSKLCTLSNEIRTMRENSGGSRSQSISQQSVYNALEQRINQLQHQVNGLLQASGAVASAHAQGNKANARKVPEESGYFDSPSQMSATEGYFTSMKTVRDASTRFNVIARQNKAKFQPISDAQGLSSLRSFDTMKLAVEVKGCSLSEATGMKVDAPGEAAYDGSKWIIKKKAIVTLLK